MSTVLVAFRPHWRGVKPAVVCNELFKSIRLCVVFALTGQMLWQIFVFQTAGSHALCHRSMGFFFKAVLLSLSTLRGQFYESMKQLGLPLPLLCKSDV